MSASESNGYKWQTNINNDDGKTRVYISWAYHFANGVHEAGHFLSPVGPYQPRLISMIYKQTTKIYVVDVFK
jgi:hypothetical protein